VYSRPLDPDGVQWGMFLAPWLALTLAAGSRIAVLPIAAGEAIPEKAAASLTETLAAELRQQSGGEVVTSRDLTGLLSLEKQKQALGCGTDSCLAELAGALGAERVVSGDVAKLGESLLLQVRLLDASRARVVAQAHRRFKKGTFDDLLDALPAMVGELLQRGAPPAVAGAPRAPPPSATAASGPLVLHYHRTDGRYDTARLLTWESFGSAAELRRPQASIVPRNNNTVSLQNFHLPTLEPSGRDAFGVYWTLSASRYRNGRVNFLVMMNGGFDECGGDQARFWIVADGREVWHLAPECELHSSLEEAERVGADRMAAGRPPVEAKGTASHGEVASARAPVTLTRLSPPPGQLVLHYRRTEGRYDDARLLTWESFGPAAELRRPQGSIVPRNNNTLSLQNFRLPTLEPSGHDAFGVYWTLPASRYRNGRVNFVVMMNGGFDECGGDQARFWITADGREAWQLSPECEIFTDPEAASRAATAG